MKDSLKKPESTLESLLAEYKIIAGKELIERHKEVERQGTLLQEAVQFDQGNRRAKGWRA